MDDDLGAFFGEPQPAEPAAAPAGAAGLYETGAAGDESIGVYLTLAPGQQEPRFWLDPKQVGCPDQAIPACELQVGGMTYYGEESLRAIRFSAQQLYINRTPPADNKPPAADDPAGWKARILSMAGVVHRRAEAGVEGGLAAGWVTQPVSTAVRKAKELDAQLFNVSARASAAKAVVGAGLHRAGDPLADSVASLDDRLGVTRHTAAVGTAARRAATVAADRLVQTDERYGLRSGATAMGGAVRENAAGAGVQAASITMRGLSGARDAAAAGAARLDQRLGTKGDVSTRTKQLVGAMAAKAGVRVGTAECDSEPAGQKEWDAGVLVRALQPVELFSQEGAVTGSLEPGMTATIREVVVTPEGAQDCTYPAICWLRLDSGWAATLDVTNVNVFVVLVDGDPAADHWPTGDRRLPAGWQYQVSRSCGDTFFANVVTGDSTYQVPTEPAIALPQSWNCALSRSGELYFFNESTGESQFEQPTQSMPKLIDENDGAWQPPTFVGSWSERPQAEVDVSAGGSSDGSIGQLLDI